MSETLKIVHIIPALTKGGAERVAVDLANASARDGHSVTLVACWKFDEEVLRVQLDSEVQVVYITQFTSGRLLRYLAGLGWVLRNRRWLAAQDVLHLHLTQAAVLGTLFHALRSLGRDKGPAIIETYHAVGMKISQRMQTFHSWNCRRRDGIALMALDSYWRDFNVRNPKLVCELIPNGVDAPVGAEQSDSVRAYLDEIGVPQHATQIIGNVGQFRADRQPLTIARILIDVLKQTPDDVHALMCGSGSELEPVRKLVEAECLEKRFTLPGVVNEPRVSAPLFYSRELYQRGDGFPLIGMVFDHHLPARADTTPFTYETSAPKEIGLNAHAVKPPHIVDRIDSSHLQVGRKNLKLSGGMRHLVIQQTFGYDIRRKHDHPLDFPTKEMGAHAPCRTSFPHRGALSARYLCTLSPKPLHGKMMSAAATARCCRAAGSGFPCLHKRSGTCKTKDLQTLEDPR